MLWVILGLLFVAPFVDPRRPLRLLHLDLLVIVIAGLLIIPNFRPSEDYPPGAVVLAVGLLYLLVRMLTIGFRPRPPTGPLLPLVPLRWLLVGIVLLAFFRIGYVKADELYVRSWDVGIVSVEGANRIAEGKSLYDDPIPFHGNTYGPVNYLFYLPFERAAEWTGLSSAHTRIVYRDLPPPAGWGKAARAAAIVFDLLTAAGLFLLGRRLRPRDGDALGIVLAYAWIACPYTMVVLKYGYNDGLVAMLIVAMLLALSSPPLRGAITALAAATKFAPAALAPLFATATDARRGRSALIFTASFLLVSAASFLPFIPDGGIRDLYDQTVGFQTARAFGPTIWGVYRDLQDVLQPAARVAAIGLALLVGFVPRRRGPLQVAALGAAVLIAVQFTGTFWGPGYVLWFLPMVLVALFAGYAPYARNANEV